MPPCLVRSAFASLAVSLCSASVAAPVPIRDPAWGGASNGIARIAFDLAGLGDDEAVAGVVLSTGQLVMAGSAETASDSTDGAFVRLEAQSGLPDPDFGADLDGRALLGIPDSSVQDVVANADGKLLYAGRAFTVSGSNALVGRLTSNGLPDPGFDGDGHRFIGANAFADGSISAGFSRVIALPGGGMLAIGYAVTPTSATTYAYRGCAMRFQANGSTDTAFGGGDGIVCVAPATAADPFFVTIDALRLADGRFLLAGAAQHTGGSGSDMAIARLTSTGTLDLSFGPADDGWAFVGFDQGQGLNDQAQAVGVDASGRIVLAGGFENLLNTDIAIARVSADGQPDTSFGTAGRVQIALDLGGYNYEVAHSVSLLPGGGLLIGANAQVNATVGVAILLKANGAPDPQFGEQGIFVQADVLGPDASIVESRRQLFAGDHIYMVGDLYENARGIDSPTSRGPFDFAATRFVLPLFSDGFGGDPAL